MPTRRDTERDKAETRRLILDPNRPPYTGGENWLGHGKLGGKDAVIDYLLLDGATMERLLEERGTEASVRSHFQSLKTVHDLPVTRGRDGKYRFDRTHLDLPEVGSPPVGPVIVRGVVRGTGRDYKGSGREALEIWVRREGAEGLPFELDKAVPVTVGLGGRTYRGRLRATSGNSYVWLSPTLAAEGGAASTLADVLAETGVVKNDGVELAVEGTHIEVRPSRRAAPTPHAPPTSGSGYARLSEYLSRLPVDRVTLTFGEVEAILGFGLPESARKYPAWWSNSRTDDSHTWAHLWLRAGWEKEQVDFREQRVSFRRATPGPTSGDGLPPEHGADEEPYAPHSRVR